MTYSSPGGYPSSPDPYGQAQPGGHPPAQPPGYPPQPDPYGWGQPPQQPGFPPPQFPAPQPPKKSNGGLIAGLVIGGLVLVLGAVLVVVLVNRSDNGGGTGSTGTSADDGSDLVSSQSPSDVVNAYYQANEDRDWDEALSYLSRDLQIEFGGASDADRNAAADELEGAVYTVVNETIAADGLTAEVDITMDFRGNSQDATLKMIIEDGGWKIDEFTV